MDRKDWRVNRLNEILGIPELDQNVLPLHVIVEVRERLSLNEEIGAVILYGSLIRGEATSKSDIDIMIIPSKPGDTEKLRKKVQSDITSIESEFRLRNPFSINIFSGKEDSNFLWESVKDGVVIFSRVGMVMRDHNNITPYALVSYSFNGLDDKSKRYIQRFLFESKKGMQIDKKNRQEYVSRGVVMISVERSKKLARLFETMGVEYSLIKIWR